MEVVTRRFSKPSRTEIAAAHADVLVLLNQAGGEVVVKELLEKMQDAFHSFLAASLGIHRAHVLGELTEHALPQGVIVARLVPHKDTKRTNSFVPNVFQREILKALHGQALTKAQLADQVCGGDGSRLYRKGGINELKSAELVCHKYRLGYYRPDAPPPSP